MKRIALLASLMLAVIHGSAHFARAFQPTESPYIGASASAQVLDTNHLWGIEAAGDLSNNYGENFNVYGRYHFDILKTLPYIEAGIENNFADKDTFDTLGSLYQAKAVIAAGLNTRMQWTKLNDWGVRLGVKILLKDHDDPSDPRSPGLDSFFLGANVDQDMRNFGWIPLELAGSIYGEFPQNTVYDDPVFTGDAAVRYIVWDHPDDSDGSDWLLRVGPAIGLNHQGGNTVATPQGQAALLYFSHEFLFSAGVAAGESIYSDDSAGQSGFYFNVNGSVTFRFE